MPLALKELRVTSADGEDLALVGSLDVCATRAVEGQVLIGEWQSLHRDCHFQKHH